MAFDFLKIVKVSSTANIKDGKGLKDQVLHFFFEMKDFNKIIDKIFVNSNGESDKA